MCEVCLPVVVELSYKIDRPLSRLLDRHILAVNIIQLVSAHQDKSDLGSNYLSITHIHRLNLCGNDLFYYTLIEKN